jgi:hypothetical protein
MAVNIFEELVKTYLQTQGYFTIENIPYSLPSNVKIDEKYRGGPSEIDIIALRPAKEKRRVLAVSCKGFSEGIKLESAVKAITTSGDIHNRDARRGFRELAFDGWGGSFRDAVWKRTKSQEFIHITAVVKFVGDPKIWSENADFKRRMDGNCLELLTLETIWKSLTDKSTRLPHHNHTVGQITGLFKTS